MIKSVLFSMLMVFIFIRCVNNSPNKKEASALVSPQKSIVKKSSEKLKEKIKKPEPPTINETKAVKEPETPAVVVYPPEQLKKAKAIIAAATEDQIAAVDARKKFRLFCSVCHGFNGNLMVNGAKDLTKSKTTLEQSVAQVYHGRGLMTPFKGVLSDVEIVAVTKYIDTELRRK